MKQSCETNASREPGVLLAIRRYRNFELGTDARVTALHSNTIVAAADRQKAAMKILP